MRRRKFQLMAMLLVGSRSSLHRLVCVQAGHLLQFL